MRMAASHRANGIVLARLTAMIIVVATLGSCSNLRYLEDDQKLYTGSQVSIESEQAIKNKKEVKSELKSVMKPPPNDKVLICRPRLWFYNIAGEPSKKGIRKWMKTKLGRPPVLWEEFDAERVGRLMENRLFNMGFFDARVTHENIEKKKTASVDFTAHINAAYTIGEILPLDSDLAIAEEINNSLEKSILKVGKVYRLSELRAERERIDKHLKDLGYFYFHPDHLLFRVDSTMGNRQLTLSLNIKPGTTQPALQPYHIRNVYVNISPLNMMGDSLSSADTLKVGEGFYIIDNDNQLKAVTLRRAVFFQKSELYTRKNHDLTLNHLMGLGVFKFVNVRFTEEIADTVSSLDVRIMLTLVEKKTLSAEIMGVSKSTNFAGPGLNISFNNRNLLNGAEQFKLDLSGSYETLLGQRQNRANSLEAGVSAELTIPRFVAPGNIKIISPQFVPNTNIALSFNYLYRTDAFSVSSVRSQFGYRWNQSVTTQHRYNPFVFSVYSLGTISDEYQQIFSTEVLFRRGLFEQFLLGSEYSFFYNSQLEKKRKHDWYFNLNLDFSGNLLYLLSNAFAPDSRDEVEGFKIWGQSFSQYSKADIDLRYYLQLGGGKRLAWRFVAGMASPYGNSSVIPYVKLFTTGGSNSIRAFHPRTLGPGTYSSPDTLLTSFNIYQSGEIKLEMNLEYRFDISRIVKAALFADAGNVWNIREREKVPGGRFDTSNFTNQIALGTGAGLRLDFTFFLLRLDLAFPLAVPSDNSPGYFQPIKPLDGQWRRDNLILNLAIGYPF